MHFSLHSRLLRSEPVRRCRLTECRAACCLHGVWLDWEEWQEILLYAPLIIPHMPVDLNDPRGWVDGRIEDDPFTPSRRVIHSRVLPDASHYGGTACVFLRDDYKCALQVAGEQAGLHPWRFKPFYCILHPLDLNEEGQITLDETDALLSEPGSCLRPSNETALLLQIFNEELRYLSGGRGWKALFAEVSEIDKPARAADSSPDTAGHPDQMPCQRRHRGQAGCADTDHPD